MQHLNLLFAQESVPESTGPELIQLTQIETDTQQINDNPDKIETDTQQIDNTTVVTVHAGPKSAEPVTPATTVLEAPITTTTVLSQVKEPGTTFQTQESQPISQPNVAETGYSLEAPLYLAGTFALAGLAMVVRKNFHFFKQR